MKDIHSLTGTVSKVEYTFGSAGNQWTTIDGIRYATWFDGRVHAVKEGAKVTHRPYRKKLWSTDRDEIDCTVINGVF